MSEKETARPGGPVAKRPLHFFFLLDSSGSMAENRKIEALNNAVRESIPQMKKVVDENPFVEIYIRSIKFSHGASWHIKEIECLDKFRWADLVADPIEKSKNIQINTEIIFLVDTSGSMSDEIEAVKSSCINFANKITEKGINVKLGLIGFDIGGYRKYGGMNDNKIFAIHDLNEYTIGIWPLTDSKRFKSNVQSLEVGLFGGGGCYLADENTVDIFPFVANSFSKSKETKRILIIISDEIGNKDGLNKIISILKDASITTYVLGVKENKGAHELIAEMTGGKFWDIYETRGKKDFTMVFENVGETIAKELTIKLKDGTISKGTDMGKALFLVAEQLKIPPMPSRALPPVLILISDGLPTDDFKKGLEDLMSVPWGKKSVRLAIAIGDDADIKVLQEFIGNPEIKPLKAHNPEQLTKYVKLASTSAIKASSSPASQPNNSGEIKGNVEIPQLQNLEEEPSSAEDVW